MDQVIVRQAFGNKNDFFDKLMYDMYDNYDYRRFYFEELL